METVEERLHDRDGEEEVKDEHTHTEVVEDNGGELAGCLGTRYEQLDGRLQERGEVVCPLEAIHDQVGSVELCGVEGMSEANGCTESLGGYGGPRSPRGDTNPQCGCECCPGVCGVEVCVYECGEMRAATHAERECKGVCESDPVCNRNPVCERDPVCGSDPVCEWCGHECAGVRASQHPVCE